MKKLEYKLLPCIICTIGVNCYVTGHNLVHSSVQKFSRHKNKDHLKNKERLSLTENLPLETKIN